MQTELEKDIERALVQLAIPLTKWIESKIEDWVNCPEVAAFKLKCCPNGEIILTTDCCIDDMPYDGYPLVKAHT